jgi:PmbA protein
MTVVETQSLSLGKERALEVLEFALNESAADATEVVLRGENTSLTRFTGLHIHQNVTESTNRLLIRTIWDGRLVVVRQNDLSKEGVRKALTSSERLAAKMASNAALPDFGQGPDLDGKRQIMTFNPATAGCGPRERAQIVERMCGILRQGGVDGAGNVRIRLLELAVGNSSGLRRYAPFSLVALVVVAFDESASASGYQNWIGRDIETANPEALAREVTVKCLMGRNPEVMEAKPMVAILEPPAVAQILFHLNFRSLGIFGAKSARNGDSIIFENLGEKITSPKISIYDDHEADGLVPMPFDYEGVEKRRLDLIKDGVAKGIAHSLASASEFGQSPTGHAQLPGVNPETGNEFGPSPQHMVMEAGTSSVSDMIESTDHGVLVSRIHGFVSPLSGKEGYLAGTTRDGLFLIEDGRVSRPIRNMRWMDRILSALEGVQSVSKERRVQFTDELWFPTFALVPTIKLERFNFVDTQRWSENDEAGQQNTASS